MFDHPIIDVALGVMFLYLILALVCSAVQEWISTLAGLRSKNLKTGIQTLVGDALAQKVYDHPMIKNLAKPGQLPSYLDAKLFSTVVLEVLSEDSGDGKSYRERTKADLDDLIGKVEQDEVKRVLQTLVTKGDTAVAELQADLAGWFDQGMERVSGWYGRNIRMWLFIVAAVVTVSTNANTLTFVETLWTNDALRTQLAETAVQESQGTGEYSRDTLVGKLDDLPLGWRTEISLKEYGGWWWVQSFIGWLITIAAISLGAPFWFDLLGKVARLRGSGDKPGEKKKAPEATS